MLIKKCKPHKFHEDYVISTRTVGSFLFVTTASSIVFMSIYRVRTKLSQVFYKIFGNNSKPFPYNSSRLKISSYILQN